MRTRLLCHFVLGTLAAMAVAGPGARAEDAFEPNDTLATSRFVGGAIADPAGVGAQLLEVEGAVLEPREARDFYSFTAFAGVPIGIRVEPLAGGASAADERNLQLRLWRRTSAANNTFEVLAQIDFNGAGSAEYHPPIAYVSAGFMVVEIDAPDGADGEQPYRLRIANQAIEPSIAPELHLLNGVEEIVNGGTLSLGSAPVDERATVELAVQNEGDAILHLDPPVLSGPAAGDFSFALSSDTIQPGGSASLAIDFEPTAEGAREAALSLPSDDPAFPDFSFALSGNGVGAAPATLPLQLGLQRLSGLSLAPEIGAVAVPIVLELSLDPSGRPVCTGVCSVAGEEVRVEAKPLKRTAAGAWVYRLKLFGALSARFAKLRGELGSAVATVSLAGPEGDAKLSGVPVDESVDPSATTLLRLFASVAQDGTLSGSAEIESGLGNDGAAPPAALTGKRSETELRFVLKSAELRRRIAFRGTRQGDVYVGKLNYRLPPAKGKLLGVEVPATLLEP